MKKNCSSCGGEKGKSDYYGNESTIDGLDRYCIDCRRDYNDWYKKRMTRYQINRSKQRRRKR